MDDDEQEEIISGSGKAGELFDESRSGPEAGIFVKKLIDPSDREFWKIGVGTDCVIIKSTYLSKKEKAFLGSLDGMRFLLDNYKRGARKTKDFQELWKSKIK